ncbi:lipopolysaccharide core heptose(II)-phosphate phosphatase [Escherichia sp. E4385]|uniref:lipopolysaccharide core heptose(II)-phosphate phosphatase n=1 Tax=Escherichia sp. E4385 TaxID=2040639 RepID=UPI0010FE0DF3|nr:lipopolysaccharide core heptose(II)-phosphate phosphatase [Escherichia sp. E4385]TLI97469.1 lipopolysaccharide core heptose(II)-phosphate phosphatase [Escherichia sp. E4385]
MFSFERLSSVKLKTVFAILVTFLVLALVVVSVLKRPRYLDIKQACEISKRYPTIIIIRHGERCDRSKNQCFSEPDGITVNGTQKAIRLGKDLSDITGSYNLYSTNTTRIRQTACFFSNGVSPTIVSLSNNGESPVRKILDLSYQSKNAVVFTHNHCLSRIAKDMRWWKLKPGYLETLVLHREANNLILDGVLKYQQK